MDNINDIVVSLNNSPNIRDSNFAEITLFGKEFYANNYEVLLKISKEALIGFATQAIRMTKHYDETKKFHIHVDPLGNPSGNQPLGFFLTNKSPSLIVSFNDLLDYDSYNKMKKPNNQRKLEIKQGITLNYKLDMYAPEMELETFEIGLKNIAEVTILNDKGVDVTENCLNLVLKITKNGLIGLGHEFLRLAHIFFVGKKYPISQINITDVGYNLGFYLLPSSCRMIIICEEFENIFYYEPNFGNI